MKFAATLVCLVALAAVASAAERNMFEEFRSFMGKFGKTYASDAEWNKRFTIFKSNMELADELNKQNGSPAFGASKFADLAPEEFKAMYLNYKPAASRPDFDVYEPRYASTPDSVDWRDKGVISPVKNQAQCGSCWAFSTTEEIESRWAQAGHKLVELSVQQIVSCDQVDQGCNGGDTVTAYQYVEKAGGLESAAEYPYSSGGGNNGNCKFNKKDIVANITGFKWATKDSDEKVMKEVIANVGPLSTCVDASTWQFYLGGVISSNCGRSLDHCVQTVGYKQVDGDNVWIVRNSWGADWGYSGYLYIEIGKDLCGIADEPTYVLCPEA